MSPTAGRALPSSVAGTYKEFEELRTSCIQDGLLSRGFGGQLRIMMKGRELVKLAELADEKVASALQDALRTPWLERMHASTRGARTGRRGLADLLRAPVWVDNGLAVQANLRDLRPGRVVEDRDVA